MTSKIIPLNPRIALAGSVNSSKKILEKLIEHNMNVVQTLGLDPKVSKNVSGYQDLMPIAEKANIPFSYFEKLNDEGIVDLLKSKDVDLLFVVGLSQIVKDPLLSVPKFGCIGYHPTKLPEGRGRGAIAWIILGKAEPAASFFAMDEGMDSGALLAQEPLTLEGNEYPQDVIDKILTAISKAMDDVLPRMKKGEVEMQEQDHSKATYLGKRAPNDGYIEWNNNAVDIELLVRSVSRPLPGAFTFYDGKDQIGVAGRILKLFDSQSFLIGTGQGNILVEEYSGIDSKEIVVGRKLGINFISVYRKNFEF
jgi:methionyl-tRNA formyltransferase